MVSLPLIPRACSKGHFHFGFGGEGCKWPGQPQQQLEGGRKWVDGDGWHGPKVSGGGGDRVVGGKKGRKRGSWPLRQRAPTLPRVWHTVHGYPPYAMSGGRDGSSSSEALLGEMKLPTTPTKMDYAQMQAFSRLLPELPRPALVADRDRRVAKPSVSMGYVYGASRIPQPVVTPPASPVRSAPITPHRHRGRQQSSDSTLSDILRSTEKRLREGSVSETIRSRRTTTSPTRTTPGQLLGPREYGVAGSRSRTPSPQKGVSSRPFTPSHERHDSQQSASSGTDSLAGEEFLATDVPSGLTSPSRKQKKTEAEVLLPQEQSRRSPKRPSCPPCTARTRCPTKSRGRLCLFRVSWCGLSRLPMCALRP